MKNLITLVVAIIFLVGCENRSCKCDDDIQFSWEDKELEDVVISVPNAVLRMGDPLAIRIERLNDEVLWKENRI
ncbi:MAG: hypothetical protein AAGA77_07055, partial [Bacteroidota bacterium]